MRRVSLVESIRARAGVAGKENVTAVIVLIALLLMVVGPPEQRESQRIQSAVAQISFIAGSHTRFALPTAIAFDNLGFLYVADEAREAISVFPPGARGDAAPIRFIAGSKTHLADPEGVSVASDGSIFVASYKSQSIEVFAPGANGNVEPRQTIRGRKTGLAGPNLLARDARGDLYVLDAGTSVRVFSRHADGDVRPLRTIAGPSTELSFGSGLTVGSNGSLFVCNYLVDPNRFSGDPTLIYITTFAPLADGNAKPIRTIRGTKTRLSHSAIAIDTSGSLYSLIDNESGIGRYSAIAEGDAAPSYVFRLPHSVVFPAGVLQMLVGPDGNLYLVDGDGSRIVIVHTAH